MELAYAKYLKRKKEKKRKYFKFKFYLHEKLAVIKKRIKNKIE